MGGGEGRPHWEQQLGGKDTIFRKYDRAADHRPCAAASFCAPFAGRGYPPLPSAFPDNLNETNRRRKFTWMPCNDSDLPSTISAKLPSETQVDSSHEPPDSSGVQPSFIFGGI